MDQFKLKMKKTKAYQIKITQNKGIPDKTQNEGIPDKTEKQNKTKANQI